MSEPYFGEPWPSGVCDNGIQVPTPVGELCILCGTPIQDGDQGSFMGSEKGLVPVPQGVLTALRDGRDRSLPRPPLLVPAGGRPGHGSVLPGVRPAGLEDGDQVNDWPRLISANRR